jgi:RHS repeat-associated protein
VRPPPRSDVFDPFQDPDCGNGRAPIGVGKPFSPLTGKEFFEHLDLEVPGVFPIEMVRRYDSASSYQSPLGYGWAFTYDWRLFEYSDGSVLIRNACGIQHMYQREANGTFVSDDTPGFRYDLRSAPGGGYVLADRIGTLHFFDAEGRLTAIQSPQRNRLEFTYDARGRLPLVGISANTVDKSAPTMLANTYRILRIAERTADGALTGRHVDFQYEDGTGRLEYIEANDGRRVTYEQRTIGAMPTGNLVKVIGLEGIEQAYEYNDPKGYHLITSIQMGQGMTPVVNRYDGVGRVIRQTHGDSVMTVEYNIDVFDTAQINLAGCDGTLSCSIVRRTIVTPGAPNRVAATLYKYREDGYPAEIVDALGHRFVYGYEVDRPYQTRVQVFENRGTSTSPNRVLQKTVDRTFDADGDLTEVRVALDSGEVITQSWRYEDGWMASRQVVSSADPGKVFRTEWTFERGGVAPGEPGYDADAPISNIHTSRRRRDDGTYDVASYDYNVNGQLARATPPAVPSNDGLEIVRTYTTSAEDGHVGLIREQYFEVAGERIPTLATLYTYDPRSFLATETDALGVTTSYAFDDLYRMTEKSQQVSPAAGGAATRVETWRYRYRAPSAELADPTQAPPGWNLFEVQWGLSGADAAAHVARFQHDGRQRLVELERRRSNGTFETFATFAYDSDSNRITSTDGAGRPERFEYDLLLRPTRVTDAVGNQWSFTYDAVGNRVRTVDSKQRLTRVEYDDLDRVLAVIQEAEALTTRFAYDAAGNRVLVQDPKGQSTQYAFDARSRLASIIQPLGVATPDDPTDFALSHVYDDRDRLVRVRNARGQVRAYTYYPWGGLERVGHFLNVAAADSGADPGRTISYTYDARALMHSTSDTDLLTSVPAGADPALEPPGRLYTFEYDGIERLVKEIAHFIPGGPAGQGRTLATAYDEFRNRVGLELSEPDELRVHTWGYDALDRPTSACMPQDHPCAGSAATLSFTYLGNDDPDVFLHGNGTTTRFAYEPQGMLDSMLLEAPGAPNPLDLIYDYDATLEISTVRERMAGVELAAALGGGPARQSAYDGVDRLVQALHPATSGLPAREDFAFDAADNRDDASETGAPLGRFAYDANNRLMASPGRSYTYDADGNLATVSDGGSVVVRAAFDQNDRLRSYEEPPTGKLAQYDYDPFGRRIRKRVSGATTWYLWDENDLLAEYDGTGQRKLRYAYAGGLAPVEVAYGASAASEAVYTVHVDHLDTPRLLTDAEGVVRWRATYAAFGAAGVTASAPAFNIRFPGQYFDAETGLHYNRERYYDPSLGRYLSPDPIGQSDHVNLYQYAQNDPFNRIDPLGLYSGQEFLTDAGNFGAGFASSLTFGLSDEIGKRTGGRTGIDKCSAAYKAGEYVEIGLEIALSGGTAILKQLAQRASRRAARNAFRNLTRKIPRNGKELHHRVPLFGHPGGTATLFPTGGLPPSIANHPFNLKLVNKAEHSEAHRRVREFESGLNSLLNPGGTPNGAATGARFVRNLLADCGCN